MVFCSALEKIIVNGYKALNLQYFFTSGKDEVKAWTIQVSVRTWAMFYRSRQGLMSAFHFNFFLACVFNENNAIIKIIIKEFEKKKIGCSL